MKNKIYATLLCFVLSASPLFANTVTLPTTGTTTFIGQAPNDRAGNIVNVGDVDGDSIPDVLIGAYNAAGGGKAYLIFGKASKFPPVVNLSSVGTTTRGVVFTTGNSTGRALAAAGDINNDGLADFVIGTGNWRAGAGFYIVSGSRNFPTSVDLRVAVPGVNSVFYSGPLPNKIVVADINRDGLSDIVCDAQFDSSVRIFYGDKLLTSGSVSAVNDSYYDGVKATKLVTTNSSGFSNPNIADVNRDGINDVLFSVNGKGYVLFGKAGSLGSIVLATDSYFDGVKGFKISGANNDSYYLNIVGDINKDGYLDIGVSNSRTAIILGRAIWPAAVDLSQLNGTNGFLISSESALYSVMAAGDYNSDGISDIALTNTWNNGAIDIVYGRSIWPASYTIGAPLPSEGVRFLGESTAKALSFEGVSSNLYGGESCPRVQSYLFSATGNNFTVGRAYIQDIQ